MNAHGHPGRARAALAAAAATVASSLLAVVAGAQPVADALADPAAAQAPAASTEGGAVLQARLAHHADALRLNLLGDDRWDALRPRRGLNLATLDDELRLQAWRGGWGLALLARGQALLVASADALALAADIDAGRRPATNQQWDTRLRLRGFSGRGLELAHAPAVAGAWRWQGSVQLLQLDRWRERRLDGPVQYDVAAGQYSFRLQSSDLNDRLRFPFQTLPAGHGWALLGAAGVRWQPADAPHWASATVHDGGWLRWRGMPRQIDALDTDTRGIDADGYLIYRPLVQGRYAQDGLTRSQPWRARLAAGGTWAGQPLSLQLDHVPGWGLLPSLRWQQAAEGGATTPRLGAQWHLHQRRLDLQLAWRGLALSVGADRMGGAARSRQLALSWQQALR